MNISSPPTLAVNTLSLFFVHVTMRACLECRSCLLLKFSSHNQNLSLSSYITHTHMQSIHTQNTDSFSFCLSPSFPSLFLSFFLPFFLSQPMKPLKAAATTSQPVLTIPQIETIFFKVPELYEIHKEFYDGLLPRVQQWSHCQRVGDLFQKQVSVHMPPGPADLRG